MHLGRVPDPPPPSTRTLCPALQSGTLKRGGEEDARDPAGHMAPPRRDSRGHAQPGRAGAVAPPPPFPGPRLWGCPGHCLTRGPAAPARPVPAGRSETAHPRRPPCSRPSWSLRSRWEWAAGGAARTGAVDSPGGRGGDLAGGGQACGGAQRCLLHFALQPRWLRCNFQIAEWPQLRAERWRQRPSGHPQVLWCPPLAESGALGRDGRLVELWAALVP